MLKKNWKNKASAAHRKQWKGLTLELYIQEYFKVFHQVSIFQTIQQHTQCKTECRVTCLYCKDAISPQKNLN